MAIRNIEAINRKAVQVAKERDNAKRLSHERVDALITTILKSYNDVKDVVDTISALKSKGLGNLYEKFEKNMTCGIRYIDQYGALVMRCGDCVIRVQTKDKCSSPINVAWNAHGLGEGYNIYTGMDDYTYRCVLNENRRGYLHLLEQMSAKLQPFCDAFFEFIETI